MGWVFARLHVRHVPDHRGGHAGFLLVILSGPASDRMAEADEDR